MKDAKRRSAGIAGAAEIRPWYQDFTYGPPHYGAAEVRAQIKAARDMGVREFLLWDPLVTYTTDALDPGAKKIRRGATASTTPKTKTKTPARSGGQGAARTASAVKANELGEVPVIMHHQIRADGGGDYDQTPAEFRAELELLYRRGYRPVRVIDLVTGRLNVPAGKSPVVLTFDDSTKEQLAWDASGKPKRDTAIGIFFDVAKRHPDFKPAGTFYVNREPFAGVADGPKMLRFLVENGFELGNHTDDHIPFDQKDAAGVQKALVRGQRIITSAVPGAKVRTMSLPLGVMPKPASLAQRGSWDGESYRNDGVLLVGANPAPSPFSTDWKPAAIPRIRTGDWGGGEPNFTSGYWLEVLRGDRGRRFVSDGNPDRISFPRELAGRLSPRLRARANPY